MLFLGDIKIWDHRRSAAPLQYISAHLAKIYGLDWSPHIENQIASASQDHTVKFFDTSSPRKADFFLSTGSPVWRARFVVYFYKISLYWCKVETSKCAQNFVTMSVEHVTFFWFW